MQDVEMFHDAVQFDRKRLRETADGHTVVALEAGEDRPSRRIREGEERPVEWYSILQHQVMCFYLS
jgi:hypothetical protein